jgi:hypothetical protein
MGTEFLNIVYVHFMIQRLYSIVLRTHLIDTKVKSLCLTIKKFYEDIGGTGGIDPPSLTSALDGGKWSASRLCRFTPGEKAPGIHWKEAGWAP